jgi:hypothetical protein
METMLKMMTARIGSMTLCVAFSSLAVSSLVAQEQSVLQRAQAETQLNSPSNNLLEAAGLKPAAPGAEQSQEDLDLLTKGPLHEAFAEVQQDSPAPNPIVARQPPEAVKELPPKYQPEGENVEWIPGYWAWDEERENYLWISGIWRDIPPGQRWVPGYWETVEGGFRWVNGFWMDDEVEEIEYLPAPPESLDNGPSTPAPSSSHFYAPGNWVYQENDYAWQPGCWMPRVENWVWVPPSYVWTPRGCVFRAGYWDRLFDCRGVVFAPVYYNRPIYNDFDYYYTPTCVINTNFDLLPHLFIRRNCRSYYFGDWYDNRYVGGGGFCAWSQIGVNVGFGRCYDPFFVYYSHSSVRYNNVGVVGWARNRYDYCFQNAAYRPPALFNVNINIINQKTVINGQPAPQPVVIADTLERRVKTTARKADGREAFRQLAEDERRDFQKRTEPIQTIARERKASERRAERELANGDPQVDPVLKVAGENAGEKARPEKLALPKVERQQQLAAERSAAELKRQQEKDERTARTEERRAATEAANAARRDSRNQEKLATENPPVLKRAEKSDQVAGGENLPSPNDVNKPRANRGPASRGTQSGSEIVGGVESQPAKLTPDQRRQANDARQQAQREATAQRDAARDLARQQEAAARDQERQQRASRNGSPIVGGSQIPNGGPVVRQPTNGSRDVDRVARQAADQQQRQQREMEMQQRRGSEQAARQASDQQRAQREMEMQQRRASEQAARQAADQQRNSEMAMRRQQEAQDRSYRQQQEMQQRQARQQQDQMRQQQQQQQQQRGQESAARQQREMERQQRDMQRQQQQQERRRGGGGG